MSLGARTIKQDAYRQNQDDTTWRPMLILHPAKTLTIDPPHTHTNPTGQVTGYNAVVSCLRLDGRASIFLYSRVSPSRALKFTFVGAALIRALPLPRRRPLLLSAAY